MTKYQSGYGKSTCHTTRRQCNRATCGQGDSEDPKPGSPGNAETVPLGKTRILGLGGNYSPTYYGFKKAKLPKGRERHYVESEIQKCLKSRNIDILITHETPSPYCRNDKDIGRQEITDILKATKPRIHFFGHHHRFGVFEIAEGIKSVCLDKPKTSWLKLDTESFRFERIITEFHSLATVYDSNL